jgi:hypothetical protein
MGLGAFVPCRCLRDGSATDPPVPRELIVTDGEFGIELSLPYEGNEDLHDAFDNWKLDGACAHEDMELASEPLANWAGYRLFQDALAAAGWEKFPALRRHLPEANGGSMPPSAARQVLAELGHFAEQAELGVKTDLVDDEAGTVIGSHVPAHEGIFVLANPWRIGVDSGGFFVRNVGVDPPREEFRAMRFTQQVLESPSEGRHGLVRFTDPDSAAEMTVDIAPLGGWGADGRYPRSLRVQVRQFRANDFDYIVVPLTTLCEAALATGNPIYWY